MPSVSIRLPQLAAAATVLALAATASPAAAQTLTYSLSPAYRDGVNGANGWYRVPVTASFTCTPGALFTLVTCPPSERFEHYAGTTVVGGSRVPVPIVRPAVFRPVVVQPPPPEPPLPQPPDVTVPVTLTIPGGAGLKVDIWPPGPPTVRTPASDAVYDAGQAVVADFSCPTDVTSGPAPGGPCVGTVADGARLDTGRADTPSTYGAKSFVVRAIDAAGNVSTRTVRYTVDELPGKPVLTTPAAGATADARSVFTWQPPADDGSGVREYRFTVTPSRGAAKTYTFVAEGPGPVSFQPPEDLPTGRVRWAVTFVDVRSRTAASDARTATLEAPVPPAPEIGTAPAVTTQPQPTFTWTPGEPGGTFTWEITTRSGGAVQGPVTTAAATARAAALAPGAYAFRVRQVNAFGRPGSWSDTAEFAVQAPPVPPPPAAPIAAVPAPTPAAPRRTGPPVRNAKLLRPRAGAGLRTVPVLRWPRARRATLYNVQVFRVSGKRYIKVFTAFPRGTTLRLATRRLPRGQRYVWRVWPYIGATRRYSAKPLGVSWFSLPKPTATRRR